jgi:plasmid stability protein
MQSKKAIDESTEDDVKALTVRNLPSEVAEALDRERRARGTSLNRTVIELLRQALGVGGARSNGLSLLAGGWTREDFDAFEEAVAVFDEVDPEMWR